MGGRGSGSGMTAGGGGTIAASAAGSVGVTYVPTPSEFRHMTSEAKTAYIQAMPIGKDLQVQKESTGTIATVRKKQGSGSYTYYTVDYDTPGGHMHFEEDSASKVMKRLKASNFIH